jgi:hypothetical protein
MSRLSLVRLVGIAITGLSLSSAAFAGTVVNPLTGETLTIAETFPEGVLTTNNLFILTTTTIGGSLPKPSDPSTTVTITAVTTDSNGKVTSVTLSDGSNLDVVQDLSSTIGAPGAPAQTYPIIASDPTGNTNYKSDIRQGDGGSSGRDGALFVSARSGDDGDTGPSFSVTYTDLAIETVSPSIPGIIVASIGGDGGNGGDGYLGASGASGGRGGAGGNAKVTSHVATISTSGVGSYGVMVQSRSGQGGDGGSGYVFSGGGGGGGGNNGGNATVSNYSNVTTRGSSAFGVFAQSLGGGAGDGGLSVGIFYGDGGSGGPAGNGGTSVAENFGSVTTFGNDAHGIFSQSIGGTGGSSGGSIGIVALGDDGSGGGDGGTAGAITKSGSVISASGRGSYGIFAQSIGGGGGSGGYGAGIAAFGAEGGPGGNGGQAWATVEANASVQTTGSASHGVFVQSVGGGGGDGGSGGGLVALGADGSSAGTGGAVSVTVNGSVSTASNDSRGVFAQSVGGGGGSANGSGGLFAMGGQGSGGGNGGTVTVTTGAGSSISTGLNVDNVNLGGDGSDGIFAQSIGGGGGSGAASGGLVALGGSGSGGGNGGVVTVTNAGSISTDGNRARGVFAQSVGGGGGTGGDSGGLATIGGTGGSASAGGVVTVNNSGSIITNGNVAAGIQVQSIGGGGGDGGSTGGVLLTIGGKGGYGGASGTVTVNHSGSINTEGNDSHAIFAQSVGGGGGNGGSAVSVSAFAGVAVGGAGGSGGNGGTTALNLSQYSTPGGPADPLIYTEGERSRGVFLQSVGGGGGNGGFSVAVAGGYGASASIAVGGSGGSGGMGGTVTMSGDLTVNTLGAFSEGIVAQSVGGGGGSGGFATSFSFAAGETAAAAFSVGVGGSGGSGGLGGAVTINSGGKIITGARAGNERFGDFSTGLVAQSVGGGGGNGGFSISVAGSGAGAASGSVAVGVGGRGGSGGQGGTVTTAFDGDITTYGDSSGGALIQSVGGGGGNGGYAVTGAVSVGGLGGAGVSVGVGGSGGSGGRGGSVSGHVGDVTTYGNQSTGVTVQSIGGGGGNGGFAVAGSIGGGGQAGGAVSVGVGGAGSSGGQGGSVIASSGAISTSGDQSTGFVAQSVGGGGGNGGFSVAGAIGIGLESVGGAVSVGVGGAAGTGGNGDTVQGTVTSHVNTSGTNSAGVVVQSLGGGGGNGGFTVAGSIGGSAAVGGAVSVGVGGAGGDGGAAGSVTGRATSITTLGENATGFIAQSVGGGGGNGGFSVAGSVGIGFSAVGGAVSVGVGGAGGKGGGSSSATGTVSGHVSTSGINASGVVVQSLGGGGGNGGFSIAGSIGGSGSVGGAVSVGVGGAGGDGGTAGSVTGTAATIETEGEASTGFLAQSVGGGGGNGGFSVAAGIGIGFQSVGGAVSVGVGGSGGLGGSAGSATGTVNGLVETSGANASGVVVQSLGGGGGNGGFTIAGSIGGSSSVGGAVSVGVGGAGGSGGNGAAVTATAHDITTSGDRSTGFLAQSVGGGGGNGGFSVAGGIGLGFSSVGGAISVGVGGAGGGGGTGGTVGATLTGDVVTRGEDADGIVAQSIGGGGGNGAFAVAGTIGGGSTAAVTVGVGVGGAGGSGGNSGAVTLNVTGLTSTEGSGSDGILAQSVGGGGGNGGFAVTGNIALAKSGAGTVGVSVGGMGGNGGAAGNVALTVNGKTDGNIKRAAETTGDDARAIVAQSVGGGGGNGGFSVTAGISAAADGAGNVGVGVGGAGGGGNSAGTASGTVTGNISTEGANASALLVQSIGGGGGNGGFNVSGGISASTKLAGNVLVGIGGYGGDGGDGAAVSGGVTGDILTKGAGAFGVTYQSVGGGGGNGGFNVIGGISVATGSTGSGTLGVGIGGFAGDGGKASTVNASLMGDIETEGSDAHAALLQSIGGGGGNGGLNVTGAISASAGTSGAVGFGLGGFGGGGGSADAVTGHLDGDVTTAGVRSFGATLQSIGGGGGNGGLNVTGSVGISSSNDAAISVGLGIGGFGGGGGTAGDVAGTVKGTYETSGDNADGVVAQSIGGGGGNGGLNVSGALSFSTGTSGTGSVGIGGFGGAGGAAGNVTLTREGLTSTDGANANGVLVQSIGGGGGNGGINVSGGISASTSGNAGSFGFGLGGFGGSGGTAGTVTATVNGSVSAIGVGSDTSTEQSRQRLNGSSAIVAQSIGGGGGNGGLNVTGDISVSSTSQSSRAMTLGVGGFGGTGGDAGAVNLTVQSQTSDRITVTSAGDDRFGVVAQSIGGGGGNGGINISGAITMNGSVTAGVGGFGGSAGLGRNVTATVDADVTAAGNNTRGVMIQSVGGGGGHGGMNISGGISRGAAASGAGESNLVFGLGGYGGAGNVSGNVVASQSGQVLVEGVGSIGVLVQSVGGGGGSGGLDVAGSINLATAGTPGNPFEGYAFTAGVGGTGGTGAHAGSVTLTESTGIIVVNGQLKTDPEPDEDPLESVAFTGNATGLLVQSIGGGGGVGGLNVAGVLTPSGGNPFVVGVGGSGGVGGDAGEVIARRGYIGALRTEKAGLIRTFGDRSDAFVAQSVGGGGGMAGMNFVFAASRQGSNTQPVAAEISVGGDTGDSANGARVTVDHNGNLITDGNQSRGLVAQSIGGGGGNANYNIGLGYLQKASALKLSVGGSPGSGGDAGDVSVTHNGTIVTLGEDSSALLAQSVGGGGGNVAMSSLIAPGADNALGISIGREGGTGGVSGNVSVTYEGTIDTTGVRSTGIMAQSVAGGGGVSGTTSVGGQYTAAPDKQYSGNVAVGLDGGTGAESGAVAVTAKGAITTRGDSARGIHAQSIGGGGGTAGSATNVVFAATGSATVGVGGKGGTAAKAGEVQAASEATILTSGDDADGILAQSIGGTGGTGGYAATMGLQATGAAAEGSGVLAINVGGEGGAGAEGNVVTVTNRGIIETEGDRSFGIRAQSIGGGGGNGGMAVYGIIQGKGESHSFNVNVGGSGGTGATGAAVTVENEGFIYTEGRDAAGISANSIGGGGGNAGLVVDALIGGWGSETNRIALNFGGEGGTGGSGGDVTVSNTTTPEEISGTIITKGDNAYGILAQSLGGGGGNGSAILSLTAVVADNNSKTFGLNIGGAGGTAESGGNVLVTNGGFINTDGEGSHGILAQSIGGGGGNGGLVFAGSLAIGSLTNTPLISVGGAGGDGGDAGTVTVTNTGEILTRAANSHGIVAQSIGGGGGNAQMAFSATGNPYSLIGSNAFAALVGAVSSGSGGEGRQVTVNHSGDITVLGSGSQAIKAESINGGGGSLSLDFGTITTLPGSAPASGSATNPLIAARAGGQTNLGTSSGRVTLNTSGTFGAGGNHGAGRVAQSIGGGGGSLDLIAAIASRAFPASDPPVDVRVQVGGSDGQDNNGSNITSSHTSGDITTTGENAPVVVIQTVGGGGGRAVVQLDITDASDLGVAGIVIGGENGNQERGGNITHTQDAGAIQSAGDHSPAALLQTIGGGGGSAAVLLTGSGAGETAFSAALGSNGGQGLDGGSINAAFNGGISTAGDHAPALLVQSIGAGGGELRVSGPSVALDLGGSNGATGSGGSIELANTGAIATSGTGAHGVFIQSIGGGGGAVFGETGLETPSLNSDNTGSGGAIGFTQTGDVSVAGDDAFGLVFQSIGGGGGWADDRFRGSAGGTGAGGAITFDLAGDVFAPGENAVGIFAQSAGADGGGHITGEFTGNVRGGRTNGVGLWMDGGATNGITIASTASVSAVSGNAITSTSGNDTITSNGFVAGNVDLGGGDNAYNNNAGATFMAYSTLTLRSPASQQDLLWMPNADGPAAAHGPGTFTNAGRFIMGLSAPSTPIDPVAGFGDTDGDGDPATNLTYGARVITTLNIDGNFVQTPTGSMIFDVAFGRYTSDRVNVTGDAIVAGFGEINLFWLENDKPVVLFETGGDSVDHGLEFKDTIALDFGVQIGSIELTLKPNYGAPFLNRNGRAMGAHMDSALHEGDSAGIGRLMAYLGNMQVGEEALYASVFDQLNPEGYLVPLESQFAASRVFASELFNCGNEQLFPAKDCVWGHLETGTSHSDATAENFGADSRGSRLRAGVQTSPAGGWAVAASLGFDDVNAMSIDDGVMQMTGHGLVAGAGIQHSTVTGTTLGASVSGGWQWMDSERQTNIFEPLTAKARPETGYLQMTARAAQILRAGNLFAEAAINVSATLLHTANFAETGLGGIGFEILDENQMIATANPEVTLGAVFKESWGTAILSLTAGAVLHSDDELALPSRFIGANPLADPAQITSEIDQTAVRIDAGLQLYGNEDMGLRLGYSGEFGERTESHWGGVDLRMAF